MKYLKLYESEKIRSIYWLLPNDDRLYDALDKINCPSEYINLFKKGEIASDAEYIFVAIENNGAWGWMPFKGNLHNYWYDKVGYTFMGVVNMGEHEIFVKKYNL